MIWIEQFLVKYPELAVFLAISIGYLIGGLKFGGFSLGPVTGSLFAGILIGQFADVPIAGMAKSCGLCLRSPAISLSLPFIKAMTAFVSRRYVI